MRRNTLIWAFLFYGVLAIGQEQGSQSVVNINISISRSVAAVNYLTNSSTRIDF